MRGTQNQNHLPPRRPSSRSTETEIFGPPPLPRLSNETSVADRVRVGSSPCRRVNDANLGHVLPRSPKITRQVSSDLQAVDVGSGSLHSSACDHAPQGSTQLRRGNDFTCSTPPRSPNLLHGRVLQEMQAVDIESGSVPSTVVDSVSLGSGQSRGRNCFNLSNASSRAPPIINGRAAPEVQSADRSGLHSSALDEAPLPNLLNRGNDCSFGGALPRSPQITSGRLVHSEMPAMDTAGTMHSRQTGAVVTVGTATPPRADSGKSVRSPMLADRKGTLSTPVLPPAHLHLHRDVPLSCLPDRVPAGMSEDTTREQLRSGSVTPLRASKGREGTSAATWPPPPLPPMSQELAARLQQLESKNSKTGAHLEAVFEKRVGHLHSELLAAEVSRTQVCVLEAKLGARETEWMDRLRAAEAIHQSELASLDEVRQKCKDAEVARDHSQLEVQTLQATLDETSEDLRNKCRSLEERNVRLWSDLQQLQTLHKGHLSRHTTLLEETERLRTDLQRSQVSHAAEQADRMEGIRKHGFLEGEVSRLKLEMQLVEARCSELRDDRDQLLRSTSQEQAKHKEVQGRHLNMMSDLDRATASLASAQAQHADDLVEHDRLRREVATSDLRAQNVMIERDELRALLAKQDSELARVEDVARQFRGVGDGALYQSRSPPSTSFTSRSAQLQTWFEDAQAEVQRLTEHLQSAESVRVQVRGLSSELAKVTRERDRLLAEGNVQHHSEPWGSSGGATVGHVTPTVNAARSGGAKIIHDLTGDDSDNSSRSSLWDMYAGVDTDRMQR